MLKLTKRVEYGLTALVHLTDRVDEVVSARQISEHYKLPSRLVGEALKDLCRADLLNSLRGPAGGYRLARAASTLTVGEIIAAIEGAPMLQECEAMALVNLGFDSLAEFSRVLTREQALGHGGVRDGGDAALVARVNHASLELRSSVH